MCKPRWHTWKIQILKTTILTFNHRRLCAVCVCVCCRFVRSKNLDFPVDDPCRKSILLTVGPVIWDHKKVFEISSRLVSCSILGMHPKKFEPHTLAFCVCGCVFVCLFVCLFFFFNCFFVRLHVYSGCVTKNRPSWVITHKTKNLNRATVRVPSAS